MFWVQISTGRKSILFFTRMDELGNRVSLLREKLPVKHLQLPLARCLLIHSLLLLGQLKWGSLSSQFWSWKFREFTGNNSFVRWFKKHILCHLVGSHWQEGQREGFCGLRKLPLSPSLPGWLQQMAKRVWHELWSQQRSTEAHVREASCCGWRQRPLWALLQRVRCWGLLSGLLSPAGLPIMATGRHAWARTMEEPATSPLSSGPKLWPCKADGLFLVPAQTL